MIFRAVWCVGNTCRWPATACRIASSICRLPHLRVVEHWTSAHGARVMRRATLAHAELRAARHSRRARIGGPTYWLTHEPENEIGAPTRPSGRRLSDELRPVIFVACSKCDWRAAFSRDELIVFHGATCAMPSLLNELTKPGCIRLGNQWGHCGVYYVEPTGGCSRRSANRTAHYKLALR